MPTHHLLQRSLYIFAYWLLLSAHAADRSSGVKPIEPDRETGIAAATVVDSAPLAHTAQLLPLNAKGELVGKGDAKKQIEQVFENLSQTLQEAGADLKRAVKLNVYAANAEVINAAKKVFGKKFDREHKPSVTFIAGTLAHPEALVAMDAVAVSKVSQTSVKLYPAAAVLPKGGVVYISGQADKGELVQATAGTLKKLKETLDFLGLEKKDVVQCKAFMQPMTEVATVKKEFEKFFDGRVPPLVFVDWTSKDVPIEIETIALSKNVNASSDAVEYLTPPGVTPSPVYAKVVRVNRGKLIYVSGLYGKSSEKPEAEILEIFDSLANVLKKSGSDFKNTAKATYYVSNNGTSGKLNELRPRFYDPKRPPAASKAMVKDIGLAGKGIVLDMIAVTK